MERGIDVAGDRKSMSTRQKTKPIYFMHIPKSGGTSLSDALTWSYPLQKIFSSDGFISVEYLRSIIDFVDSDSIILGHPGLGVARFLADKADIITLLRAPDRHAVSNFLQIRRHPGDPRHHWAMNLSFTDYIRKFPDHIVNQTLVLDQAIMASPLAQPSDLGDHAVEICSFLRDLKFSGVLEMARDSCHAISDLVGRNDLIRIRELNSARSHGERDSEIYSLCKEYNTLKQSGEMRKLFKIEEMTYRTAMLRTIDDKKTSFYATDEQSNPICRLYPSMFSSHQSLLKHSRIVVPIDGTGGHLVFGPYLSMRAGVYKAKYYINESDLELQGSGVVSIEVVVDRNIVLAHHKILHRSTRNIIANNIIHFCINADTDSLEFRISASRKLHGKISFSGVDLFEGRGPDALLSRFIQFARRGVPKAWAPIAKSVMKAFRGKRK